MSLERRKIRVGTVISDKTDKTVVVQVEWRRRHPLYKKSMRRRTRFQAHDAENKCLVGDLVRIVETRPLSKFKRWRVDEILAREEIAEIQPEDIQLDELVDGGVTAETDVLEESATAQDQEPAAEALAETEEPADEPDEPTDEEPAEEADEPADEGHADEPDGPAGEGPAEQTGSDTEKPATEEAKGRE